MSKVTDKITCRMCKKQKTIHGFSSISGKICNHCRMYNDPTMPKKEKVPCKCLKCDKAFFSDFKFGICPKCKESEEYKLYSLMQSHSVGA